VIPLEYELQTEFCQSSKTSSPQ